MAEASMKLNTLFLRHLGGKNIHIFTFRISEMRNFYNGISPNSGNAEFL